MSKAPIFSVFCIDYRYNSMLDDFYTGIGLGFNYFSCSTAGAALCLGYKKYCKSPKGCHECGCDPDNPSIITLKRSVVENLNIALTLKDITDVYLINHEDCGAIRAFLACSGYPNFGENNKKEININEKLLVYAAEFMDKKFPEKKYKLGLIDINGTVAYFSPIHKEWTVVFIGKYEDPQALWYGLNVGDTYKG